VTAATQRDVVAIGTSAGGIEALRQIAKGLPADLPASVLVVIHLPPRSPGLLPQILSRSGPLPAAHAEDGEPLRHGRIYVARAGLHMLLEDGAIRLVAGARENLYRPAIDPLFRSAALAGGRRVIGVVLTGALDDGTAGLRSIKRCGGLAVVQDPADATYPSMPLSAMRNVRVDHCVPLAEIPALLDRLTREPVPDGPHAAVPPDMKLEVGMAAMDSNEDKLDRIGKRSTFTCPECHGTLWEMGEEGVLRFRCHVGHAYTAETLVAEQSGGLEDALWAAVRAFEENSKLAARMAERARGLDDAEVERKFAQRAETARQHADEVRALLARMDARAEFSA
jgi:two-component system, chemotaxis family, protein-glutamate methylesterase/glutaminase